MTPTGDNTIAEKPLLAGEKSAEPSGEQKKRIPMASIPVTILIGLLIAALYLGGRILTAHRAQKPVPVIHAAISSPVPAVTPVPTPAPAPVPAPVVVKAALPAASEIKPEPPRPQSAATGPTSVGAPAGDSDDAVLPTIQPRSGERFLQVGALDPDAKDTRRFVERLRGEGLDPHVAEGPAPALMRVLIGPFTKIDALNEKKAQIESEGIDTFVREY